jgi:hypothetical protein
MQVIIANLDNDWVLKGDEIDRVINEIEKR